MADRTVYGRDFSENGWRMVDQGSCVWVKVPGTDGRVSLQIREGQPAKILGAFAADWNAYIEPVRDADSACWTATNSVSSSNHLSGTACDICWSGHPFRVKDAGFNAAQIATMREMLKFYEDTVFWGNDWDNPKDAMHVQMGYDTYGSENVGRVQDFINRKIRADGFSTFRRGGTVTPPAPASNAADILARATGITQAKAEQILAQVQFALTKANCTNPRRIAAALAQWVIESGHFVYTEEIASGPETQERWKYKGRTWVQLTWLENYRGFSEWCHGLGLVPTPDYFVQRPRELAEQKWAALGPAYWWAIKYPRINEYADRGDIDNVSKWVNAPAWVDNPNKHANHEAERRAAYNKALALGDQLLALTSDTTQTPPTSGDDMSAEDVARLERKIDILLGEGGPDKKGPSRSFMAIDGSPVESQLGFIYNIDGNVWSQQLTWAYLFDVELAIEVVETVARNGAYAGSWVQSESFNAWLREFGQQYCQGLIAFKAALVSKLTSKSVAVATSVDAVPVTNVTNVVDTRALESEIAHLSDQFELLRISVSNQPAPPSTDVAVVGDSTGDKIQRAVDSSMDYTDHVLGMDAAKRTALTRALQSINPVNGDQA